MNRLARTIAVLAAIGGTACDDPVRPTPAAPTPVDSLLADIARWPNRFDWPVGLGLLPLEARCVYDPVRTEHMCPPVTQSGLTTTMRFRLTSGGVAQAAFDDQSTDAVHARWTITGSLGGPGVISIVESSAEFTLTGLTTDDPLLNGSASRTTWWSHAGNSGSVTADLSVTNLGLPRRTLGEKYPRAGSITSHLHGPGYADTGPFDTRTTYLFDGTAIVMFLRTEGGTTRSCTYDLTPRDPEAGNGITCN